MQKKILFVPSFAAASFFPSSLGSSCLTGLEQGAAWGGRLGRRGAPAGMLHGSPARWKWAAGSFGATQGIRLLWQRRVFKWETQVRHEELRTPLQGSWTLSLGDIARPHTSSQVPDETKRGQIWQNSAAC